MSEVHSTLIVFAKIPQPNNVKTRLTTLLTPEDAARLYEAFLLDALDSYLQLGVDVRLYFGPSDLDIPDAFEREGVSIYWQKGDGLGPRMANAFAETFLAGYQQAVIIGTDHPTLPGAFIAQAFSVLNERQSVSIGPSEDGGYYLLGMNEFYPGIFDNMTYSHDKVFEQTLSRIIDSEATLHVLPTWYDVDEPESLKRLIQDMAGSNQALIRTRKMLNELETTYPSLTQ